MHRRRLRNAPARLKSNCSDKAGLSSSYFTRMLRISFLAPDITQAILHGRQPADLNAHKLMADNARPVATSAF